MNRKTNLPHVGLAIATLLTFAPLPVSAFAADDVEAETGDDDVFSRW